MDLKRSALGVCFAAIIVLSCTLASASAVVELELNKTVWDPDTGTWVDEITAQVGDIVVFKVNFTCKNFSELCQTTPPPTTPPTSFFYDDDNLSYGDDIFVWQGSSGSGELSNDIYYSNTTLTLEIVGCGKGINNATVIAQCFTEGNWTEVDRISDTATVNVECPEVPEVPILTPTGLIALVSLLSVIAAVTIVRKRR